MKKLISTNNRKLLISLITLIISISLVSEINNFSTNSENCGAYINQCNNKITNKQQSKEMKKHSYFRTNKTPFDIHLYFTKDTYESALKVRENMSKAFPKMTFYDPVPYPIGPHPLPMWEAHFSNIINDGTDEELGRILIWLIQNRNGHSVIIHPNTQDMRRDHSTDAIWIGTQLTMNMKIFDELGH